MVGTYARDRPCDRDCDFLHDNDQPAPLVCSLTAGQHGARIKDWRTLLDGARREPLPDRGMRVHLPLARARKLAQLVVRLTFAGDHVEFDARAPNGADLLLANLLGEQVCSC